MADTAVSPPDETTILPEADPQTRSEIAGFSTSLRASGGAASARARPRVIGPDGAEFDVPPVLAEVMLAAAQALASGYAVTIAPVSTTLSTYQAAEMLGISRPTLIKLLEQGEIPYEKTSEKPSAHRRIKLSHVIEYRERRRKRRRRILDEMTADAVEIGGYEDAPDGV